MITTNDIPLLVASGEGYNVEFKNAVPSKVKELSEEVCAFANAAGGVLLIGVSDSNTMNGVRIDNAKRSSIQNSLNEITPQIACSLIMMEIDGKSIGVIEVPSSPQKPYVLSGAIYVRIGPNTQKLTTAEQMRDFFQQSDRIFLTNHPVTSLMFLRWYQTNFCLCSKRKLIFIQEYRTTNFLIISISLHKMVSLKKVPYYFLPSNRKL